MEDKIAIEIGKAISTTLGTPLSEISQLIADKVRFLRWKNAIQTLERAREIADKKGGSLSCPPLKFFLPFMEGCSLEPSSEDERSPKNLTDEWANLLNSAAAELKSDHLIFTRILREITAREAALLSRIVADESYQDTEISLVYESIGAFKNEPKEEIVAALGMIFSSPVSVQEFLAHQEEVEREVKINLSSRGVSTYELNFYDNFADQAVGTNSILSFSDGIYSDLDEVNVLDATDVLMYHGILDSGSFLFELPFILEGLPLTVSIVGASVTRLGAHFAETCISPNTLLQSRG